MLLHSNFRNSFQSALLALLVLGLEQTAIHGTICITLIKILFVLTNLY